MDKINTNKNIYNKYLLIENTNILNDKNQLKINFRKQYILNSIIKDRNKKKSKYIKDDLLFNFITSEIESRNIYINNIYYIKY